MSQVARTEFEYRLKTDRVAMRAALFGLGAVFLGYLAATNDRGLVLFVIPLSREKATVAYAAFGAMAGAMAAWDAWNVERRGGLRQRVALTDAGLAVPASRWSEDESVIPYADVTEVQEFTEPDHVLLITHRGGTFTLELAMLPDERAFGELVLGLAARVQAAHAAAAAAPGPGPSAPA